MERFVEGYINAALVLLGDTTDFDDSPETYSVSQLSPQAIARMNEDCQKFQEQAGEVLTSVVDKNNYSVERAGNDFWLTRNGHGAGFWDRDELPEGVGDKLTKIAKEFGTVDLYVGDDSLLYLS